MEFKKRGIEKNRPAVFKQPDGKEYGEIVNVLKTCFDRNAPDRTEEIEHPSTQQDTQHRQTKIRLPGVGDGDGVRGIGCDGRRQNGRLPRGYDACHQDEQSHEDNQKPTFNASHVFLRTQ
jgi:hypothetical protein